jgi:hypothetical protein
MPLLRRARRGDFLGMRRGAGGVEGLGSEGVEAISFSSIEGRWGREMEVKDDALCV